VLIRRHRRPRLLRFLLYFLMLAVMLTFATPFLWMFGSAFKTQGDIFAHAYPLTWETIFPARPTLDNFASVIFGRGIGRNFLNNVIVAAAQVVLTLTVCAMAAYAFARLRFPGRDALFGLVLFAALIPFEATMIPLFQVMGILELRSTYFALFLPWIANPLGIFLLRQAFLEVPRDYEEAAIIEGASRLQIFWNIVLPMSRPALITLVLLTFLWSWNSYLWPLIVMQDSSKQVIQVAIASFSAPEQLPSWGDIFAASALATVPVLTIFLLLQRYYVRGVAMSGLK
jgi:ABC-type glycerol-3-phosphate transport system permease component